MANFAVILAVSLSVVALSSGSAIKVHPALASVLKTQGTANIVVSFDGTQNVLNKFGITTFATRSDKLNTLRHSLLSHTTRTQFNVQSILSQSGTEFKSFWINNKIFISNARSELVKRLSNVPEVTEIREQKTLHIVSPVESRPSAVDKTVDKSIKLADEEWGLINIQAPEAWAAGFEGEGAVVATIDTGVRSTHETLAANFRTEYGWRDPYLNTEVPVDNVGHGTHVTGTIAGAFQIGVAPKAKWIACRGCNTVSCTEAALVECGQWVTCPTLADGTNERCETAPNVVSNSWGGGQGDTFYNDVIAAWKEAGIVPVFANGNSGPLCETANSPADQENVIAVGSTNNVNSASIFSSKGPSIDGKIKPDVCAPGTNVNSAYHTSDTAYSVLSGTSMAAPHASGVVTLMLAANPNLTFEQVDSILKEHSDRDLVPTARNCGGIDTSTFPNNSYGHGKVNALKAAQAAKDHARK